MARPVGGIIRISANGERFDAKGEFTYNLGTPKREAVIGEDGVHGYMEKPQVAFLEGAITDRGTLDYKALTNLRDATVVCELANGRAIAYRDAWFAGEGSAKTREGEVSVRFEAIDAELLTQQG